MNVYRIVDDLEIRGRWFLGRIYDPQGNRLNADAFTNGVPVPSAPPAVEVELSDVGQPLDFNFADRDVPIVTPEIAGVLRRLAPSETQALPAKVRSVDERFELLNVARKIRCLDEQKSDVMWWQEADGRPDKVGQYRMVTRFVVVAEKVRECPIFRIDGWEIALLVSEELKLELERIGVRGARFQKLQASDDG